MRRTSFREKGVPHTLILLSDVSRALREEERSAWQRLIRVLGHELNNSLTPIKSIAGTLLLRVKAMEIGAQEQADFEKGLGIIEARSASLNRFLQAYRQIAQMPGPKLQPTAGTQPGGAHGGTGNPRSASRWSPDPTLPSAPTPISWNRCSSTSCATPLRPSCKRGMRRPASRLSRFVGRSTRTCCRYK